MKVLVTGSYNAGKSSFIDRVTRGTSLSIDRAGTTVAMDYGVTSTFGVEVHLFGTPGLKRFSILRKILSEGADGIIFMIDSTDPSSFVEGDAIYEEIRTYLPKVPAVVCANKQDLKGALSPEELERKVPYTKGLIILGTSAVTGAGVDEAIKIIMLAVLRRLQVQLRTIDREGKNGLEALVKALGKDEQETRFLLQWLSWRRILLADWEQMRFSLAPRVREIVEIFEIIEKRKILE